MRMDTTSKDLNRVKRELGFIARVLNSDVLDYETADVLARSVNDAFVALEEYELGLLPESGEDEIPV